MIPALTGDLLSGLMPDLDQEGDAPKDLGIIPRAL